MDFTNTFKSEIFRPLVTLVVPGAVALGPYIIVAGAYVPQVRYFWDDHPNAFVAIISVCVLACGLLLEDIGMQLEQRWFERLKRDPTLDADAMWDAYLKLEIDDELVGQRFLRITLTWMKFELAMAPALLALGVGLVWVHCLYNVWHGGIGIWLVCLFLLALIVYLIWESYYSAKALALTRKRIVEAVRDGHVKGKKRGKDNEA